MTATKAQAARRAAKKLLGELPPPQGVPWRELREAAEQLAARKRHDDRNPRRHARGRMGNVKDAILTLNEAAGVLAMEPDTLRRLVKRFPVDPPLFTRATPEVGTSSTSTKPTGRKLNTVSRVPIDRLEEWHESLVKAGEIKPFEQRIDPDAMVGGDGTGSLGARQRVRGLTSFRFKANSDGKVVITDAANFSDLIKVLEAHGGLRIGLMVMTLPEVLRLPWQDTVLRDAWAEVFLQWTEVEEARLLEQLRYVRSLRLDVAWYPTAQPEVEPPKPSDRRARL